MIIAVGVDILPEQGDFAHTLFGQGAGFGQFVLGLNLLCFQCSQRNLFLFFLCCQTRCFVGCGHALTRRDNGARIGL